MSFVPFMLFMFPAFQNRPSIGVQIERPGHLHQDRRTEHTSRVTAANSRDLVIDGSAIVYRLHDVGYAIDLERASGLLAPSDPVRARPARGEAEAIQIKNPPVSVTLGDAPVMIGGEVRAVRISARVFDFGV